MKGQNLDDTNFEAFANDKINVAKVMISVLDRLENIVGKEEITGFKYFQLFCQCFQSLLFRKKKIV